jgi:hypothetical protein
MRVCEIDNETPSYIAYTDLLQSLTLKRSYVAEVEDLNSIYNPFDFLYMFGVTNKSSLDLSLFKTCGFSFADIFSYTVSEQAVVKDNE